MEIIKTNVKVKVVEYEDFKLILFENPCAGLKTDDFLLFDDNHLCVSDDKQDPNDVVGLVLSECVLMIKKSCGVDLEVYDKTFILKSSAT